jgi:hypothetical protein
MIRQEVIIYPRNIDPYAQHEEKVTRKNSKFAGQTSPLPSGNRYLYHQGLLTRSPAASNAIMFGQRAEIFKLSLFDLITEEL